MLVHQHRAPSLWSNGVPVGPVEVNRSHPLSAGLVACYVPGCAAGFNDLSSSGIALTPDIGGSMNLSREGYGYLCSAVTASANSAILSPAWALTSGTLFWRGMAVNLPQSGAGANQVLWGVIQSTAPTPNACYAIVVNPNTTTVEFSYAVSSTANLLDSGFGLGIEPCSIAVSFTVGGAITIYNWTTNGAHPPTISLKTATATWTGAAPDYTQGGQACIGIDPVSESTDFSGAITTAAYLYNVPLNAGQIARLNAAPYDILRPVAAGLRIPPAAAFMGNPYRRWNRTYLVR